MRLRPTPVGLAIGVLSLPLAAFLYNRLPGSIPIHWNIHGKVNGSVPKPWGPFLYPCMIGCTALLAAVLPMISPRNFRIEPFARVFDLIMLALIALLTCFMAAIFAGALGIAVPLVRIVPASTGLILVVIGNVMSKTTPNFFVGIKTPWTLASPEVWLRTHRLGGRLLMLGGLVLFGAGALGLDLAVPLAVVIAAALIPIAYSFLLYRRLGAQAARADGR